MDSTQNPYVARALAAAGTQSFPRADTLPTSSGFTKSRATRGGDPGGGGSGRCKIGIRGQNIFSVRLSWDGAVLRGRFWLSHGTFLFALFVPPFPPTLPLSLPPLWLFSVAVPPHCSPSHPRSLPSRLPALATPPQGQGTGSSLLSGTGSSLYLNVFYMYRDRAGMQHVYISQCVSHNVSDTHLTHSAPQSAFYSINAVAAACAPPPRHSL